MTMSSCWCHHGYNLVSLVPLILGGLHSGWQTLRGTEDAKPLPKLSLGQT